MNAMNASYTLGLFYEFRMQSAGAIPVYNLKAYDWKGTKSMYQIYMNCDSEYEAAMTLLGDWSHWKRLCECGWFKQYIDSWREEVLIREAALGKAVIIQKASEGNLTAAKELVNQLNKKTNGRPSKESINKDTTRLKAVDAKVVNLLSRMNNV